MTCRHVLVTCRWKSPSFLLAEFIRGHSTNWETVNLHQCSISVQPMREKVKSLKHVKLRVDTFKAAKHTTTDNPYENSCTVVFIKVATSTLYLGHVTRSKIASRSCDTAFKSCD